MSIDIVSNCYYIVFQKNNFKNIILPSKKWTKDPEYAKYPQTILKGD